MAQSARFIEEVGTMFNPDDPGPPTAEFDPIPDWEKDKENEQLTEGLFGLKWAS